MSTAKVYGIITTMKYVEDVNEEVMAVRPYQPEIWILHKAEVIPYRNGLLFIWHWEQATATTKFTSQSNDDFVRVIRIYAKHYSMIEPAAYVSAHDTFPGCWNTNTQFLRPNHATHAGLDEAMQFLGQKNSVHKGLKMKTFIKKLEDGEVKFIKAELYAAVNEWNESDRKKSTPEYLGMSNEEFSFFLNHPVEYVERLQGYNQKSCPGIPLGDGNFSGCSGGKDCPVCGGDADWLEKLINRKLEADRPSDAEFYLEIQVAADSKEKLFEVLRGISSYMPLYRPMIEGTKKEVQQEEFAYRIDIVNWSEMS